MKIMQKLVWLLVFFVLLCGGFVACILGVSRWEGIVTFFAEARPLELWVGIGTLALAVLFALTSVAGRGKERFLSFQNEGGTVSISTLAISEFVAKLAPEFPSIVRMRPCVIPLKNAIDIVAELKVKSGSQVHEVCELLQNRIRTSVTEELGISQIRRVKVTVRDIVSEHRMT